MSPPASSLYMGSVMHHRLRPRAHRLRYRIFMALLDLDEIDALARSFRLFSRGRFNLFAFHAGDYGNGTGEPLRLQLERHMRAAGLTPDGGPIRLLTMPRMLGFAFNPVSLFFCHRRDGTLVAIHYEVNNTFGERHGYFLPVTEDGAPTVHQHCAKAFHVSPFIGMGLRPPGRDARHRHHRPRRARAAHHRRLHRPPPPADGWRAGAGISRLSAAHAEGGGRHPVGGASSMAERDRPA